MTPAQQHRDWRPDVRAIVLDVEHKWDGIEGITYVDHPWPGWDNRSVDFWDDASRWLPAGLETLRHIRAYLMDRRGPPFIRHTILRHTLWTSFGGYSEWVPDDHSGRYRHLHVTYW